MTVIGDLVVRNTQGNVYVLPGRGWGWFGRAYGPFPAVPALSSLSAGQMTGNAAPDLVGVDGAGKLQVLAYNGLTNLLPSVTTNLHRSDIVQVLNVGDWNGDGRGDIVTRLGGRQLARAVARPGQRDLREWHLDGLRLEVVHAARGRGGRDR